MSVVDSNIRLIPRYAVHTEPNGPERTTIMIIRSTYAQGYRDGQDAYHAGLSNRPVGVVQSQHYACGFFDGHRDIAAEEADES